MDRAQVTEKHLRVQLQNLNNSWPLQENVKDQFDLLAVFLQTLKELELVRAQHFLAVEPT